MKILKVSKLCLGLRTRKLQNNKTQHFRKMFGARTRQNESFHIFEFVLGARMRKKRKYQTFAFVLGARARNIRESRDFRTCAWCADAKKTKIQIFEFALGARTREKENFEIRIFQFSSFRENGQATDFRIFDFLRKLRACFLKLW